MMTEDVPIPNNSDLERIVISELMLESYSDCENMKLELVKLKPADFYDKQHLKIIRAMIDILMNGEDIDIISLNHMLPDITPLVCELSQEAATSALLQQHIKHLKSVTAHRLAYIEINNFKNILNISTDPVTDLSEFSNNLSGIINEATIGVDGFKSLTTLNHCLIKSGISSGYVTHDWNDSGFKPGKVTLLLGYRGHGKTTLARQFLMASSKQKHNCMFFSGESQIEEEKANLALLCANDNETVIQNNLAGRQIIYPSDLALDRFESYYSEFIQICGTEISKDPVQLWKVLMQNMQAHSAKKQGKLYIIDNMMIINNAPGQKKFPEQKQILQTLKQFTKDYDSHVVLLAHPKKGEGFQTTSGLLDQENLVDTIIRYVRIHDEKDRAKRLQYIDIPDTEKEKVSAVLLTEKIRDRGTELMTLFEYNEKRGAIIELSTLPKAIEYQNNGYWVRYINRISNKDVPGAS